MRTGFIAIIGRPNVGKSTLLNRLLGQKLAIVSRKPQTTRDAVRGILTSADAQIVFVDTPGLHAPRDAMGKHMIRGARRSFREADVIFLMVEPRPPEDEDMGTLRDLRRRNAPIFLLINKADTVRREELLPVIESYRGIFPFKEIVPVSARKGVNIERLLDMARAILPEGDRIFPDDYLSDQPSRFATAEMIREKIFAFTHQEIPYGAAVRIEEMRSQPDGVTVMRATIIVEKESHKGILIGRGGKMIKRIGSAARRDIEGLIGGKVYLDLRVKVLKDWKKSEKAMRQLGYGA